MKIALMFQYLRTALLSNDEEAARRLLIARISTRFDRDADRSSILANFALLLDDAAQSRMPGMLTILTHVASDWYELTEIERAQLRPSLLHLARRTDDTAEFLAVVELLCERTCTPEEVAAVAATARGSDETRRFMVAHALGHALRDATLPAARERARAELRVLTEDPSEAVRSGARSALAREGQPG